MMIQCDINFLCNIYTERCWRYPDRQLCSINRRTKNSWEKGKIQAQDKIEYNNIIHL